MLDSVVIDARHARPKQQLGWTDLRFPEHLAGRAVLVNFGWDRYWGTEMYRSHPYVSRDELPDMLRRDLLDRRRRRVKEFVELRKLGHVVALRERRFGRQHLAPVAFGDVAKRYDLRMPRSRVNLQLGPLCQVAAGSGEMGR